MTKEDIIQNTIRALAILPDDKAKEVSDFADFLLKKHEDLTLQKGIYQLQSESDTFNFLNEEEYLYSPADIKEKF
ncbi:MAG TPA: hypothetical protein VM884_09045 [Flavisolibacter sp.]|nr:hypothetical protein [Flavisolibacter sp.]